MLVGRCRGGVCGTMVGLEDIFFFPSGVLYKRFGFFAFVVLLVLVRLAGAVLGGCARSAGLLSTCDHCMARRPKKMCAFRRKAKQNGNFYVFFVLL